MILVVYYYMPLLSYSKLFTVSKNTPQFCINPVHNFFLLLFLFFIYIHFKMQMKWKSRKIHPLKVFQKLWSFESQSTWKMQKSRPAKWVSFSLKLIVTFYFKAAICEETWHERVCEWVNKMPLWSVFGSIARAGKCYVSAVHLPFISSYY